DVRQGNARLGRRADRPDIRGDLRPEIRAPRDRLRKRNLWSLPFLQHRF
ncbi:hypothetical protein AZZ92_005068, partial [Escherichia coli]